MTRRRDSPSQPSKTRRARAEVRADSADVPEPLEKWHFEKWHFYDGQKWCNWQESAEHVMP